MKNLGTLYYDDIESFVCDVADQYDKRKDDLDDISIIAKYDEAKEIIKELLCIDYDLFSVEIKDVEYNGYDDEYIISLFDKSVYCEPFKRDTGYIHEDSTITYISNECNSKCLDYVGSNKIYAFEIGDEQEIDVDLDSEFELEFDCDEDCENCPMCDDDSRDNYTVTIKANVDADEAMKVIDTIEKRINRMHNTFKEMFMFDSFFGRRRL